MDQKEFVKQITSIKQHEACIHCIRDKQLPHRGGPAIEEEVATLPEACILQYIIQVCTIASSNSTLLWTSFLTLFLPVYPLDTLSWQLL
jgi:hypothetical protein